MSQLQELIGIYPHPLEFSAKELNYQDKKRAETLVGVLRYLIEIQAGFEGASENSRLEAWAIQAKPDGHEELGIPGFGLSGFQYLRILFGAQTVKPDVHIRRFVSEALDRPVKDVDALTLLEAAGKNLEWRLTSLDYAIWDRLARTGK